MSSPIIERLRGQNDVWQQIARQLKESEVIGNIHENPELLGGEDGQR